MGPPLRRGSAVRAWVVGHDGFGVGAAIATVGLSVSAYASTRVPSPYGGPIPMWFLTPPALAMLSGLSVQNAIPHVAWSSDRQRRARLAWSLVVVTSAGLAATLVGANAGQRRLPELAVALTALTFGLAPTLGRASAGLGAACLVVVVVSTQSLHDRTPAQLWDELTGPGQLGLGVVCVGCVAAYASIGPRRSRSAPSG